MRCEGVGARVFVLEHVRAHARSEGACAPSADLLHFGSIQRLGGICIASLLCKCLCRGLHIDTDGHIDGYASPAAAAHVQVHVRTRTHKQMRTHVILCKYTHIRIGRDTQAHGSA